jgi:hypothetical protein
MEFDKDTTYRLEHAYMMGWLQATVAHIGTIAEDGHRTPMQRLTAIQKQVAEVAQDIQDWEHARKEHYGSL